jgi:hypothetical protein
VETYKVGLTVSGTGDYLELAKASLRDTTSWEWTNKTSRTSVTGNSQSASLTIGGPSYGYQGGTLVRAYYDNLYGTFAFSIINQSEYFVGVQGVIKDADGHSLNNSEVKLVENGRLHRTFTDALGQFVFLGDLKGPLKIEAEGVTQTIPQDTRSTHEVTFPLNRP